ncbi:MAG: hypothetical protein ACT4PV_12045 [Planctomycetaceae bacterium]
MRNALILLICLEGATLLAAGGAFLLFPDAFARERLRVPEFVPRIDRAAFGESARYRIEELGSGRVRGYLEYAVRRIEDLREQGLGRFLTIEVTELDETGSPRRNRQIVFKPRLHGWMPPLFDEDEWAPGEQPVLKTLTSTPVVVRKREVIGFLVEAVRPMFSVEAVRDRYWFAEEAPVFGLARRETDGLAYVLQ